MTNVRKAIEQLEAAEKALLNDEKITTGLFDSIRQALMVILYAALTYDGKVSFKDVKKHVKNIDSCMSDIDYIYVHFHNLKNVDEYLSWDVRHIIVDIDYLRKEMEVFI